MNASRSIHSGHRLLRAGALLFLAALLVGLVVSRFSIPRLGLSAHLLGVMQGLFLLVLGVLWPRLKLAPMTSLLGSWLAIYGCVAAWIANVLAGYWGAGSSMLPNTAGTATGSAAQELVITLALRSGAIALIVTVLLLLWGLRSPATGLPGN
jgi:hydroxylaminobenzene mutase